MNENQKINTLNKEISKPNISYSYFSNVIEENFLLEKAVILRNKNEMIQDDKLKFKMSEKEEIEQVHEKILSVKKKIPENKFTYNLGRWTKTEHQKFIEGLCLFQKDYERVSEYIKTRSIVQVRSHSQKFFKKYKEKLLKNQKLLSMKEKISSFSIKQLIKIFILCKKNKCSSNLKIKEMISTIKKRRIKKLRKSTLRHTSHKKYLNNVNIYFTQEIKNELPDFTLESPIFIDSLIKNVPNLTKLYLFCREIEKQWIDKLKSLEEKINFRGGKIPSKEEQTQD